MDETLRQYIDELRLKEKQGEPLDAEAQELLNAFYRDISRQLEEVTGPTVERWEAQKRKQKECWGDAAARAEAAKAKVERKLKDLDNFRF